MTKVDQILADGSIVQEFDQPLSNKEIDCLFYRLFGDDCVKDRKQYLLFNRIGVLVANVTYLGHPWPIYKKRIQLKSYFPDYYNENLSKKVDTLFAGIYHFQSTFLFVVFEPSFYVKKKSHNSSAHVQTFDLAYAVKNGSYSKTDAMGNFIRIMDKVHFTSFIKNRCMSPNKCETYDEILNAIHDYFSSFFDSIPTSEWLGTECYKEMRDASAPNYRQGEWQGWYFEYLFNKYWQSHKNEKIRYYGDKRENGVDFDLVFDEENWLFGDLKSDEEKGDILGNKFESFDNVILKHGGRVVYIVLRYKAELDKKHGYKTTIFWNDSIREKSRRYETFKEIENGYGARMKYSVKPKSIKVLSIDKVAYEILKKNPFHQGKNSDGETRKPKLKISKDMVESLAIYTRTF